METLTASLAKILGADSKTYLFLPKTVKLATKFVSYDSIRKMQYYANLSQLSFSPTTNVIHCLPVSQSEVGIGTETGLNKAAYVKFQLEKECQFGDRFLIIGDDPVMGSWNPSDAIPLNWSEGHIWSLLLELPVEKSIQYKVFLKKSTGEILWQPGPDRSFQAWETKNVITVSEEWENAEAQKISEEQVEEELMPKTLVEPSVLAPHGDLIKEHALAVYSRKGDLGSDDASAEDEYEDHLTENASSSGGKKEKNTDGKPQRNKMGSRRQAKADKYSAAQEDEGILITEDEGPVLVPGLTLLVSSSEEDFGNDN